MGPSQRPCLVCNLTVAFHSVLHNVSGNSVSACLQSHCDLPQCSPQGFRQLSLCLMARPSHATGSPPKLTVVSRVLPVSLQLTSLPVLVAGRAATYASCPFYPSYFFACACRRPYGFLSDSWALGCLLYEMTTLTVPFEARSMNELRYKVLRST
jgi:serine/threonine protein kinase